MKPKYCLPIIKQSKDEILEIIKFNMADYDFFEVWLDYVEDLDEKFINHLIKLLGGRLILLFRRQNLEKVKMNKYKKMLIIKCLNSTPAMLDLDIIDQKNELDEIKKYKYDLKLIVSYHDYFQTPAKNNLKEIIEEMTKYDPKIYKIASFCDKKEDSISLLELLLELKKLKLKCIILGMGPLGYITRIFGTIWGNEMIFTPLSITEQSVPGQLTKKQLKIIYNELSR